jgi:hypothetical protein
MFFMTNLARSDKNKMVVELTDIYIFFFFVMTPALFPAKKKAALALVPGLVRA